MADKIATHGKPVADYEIDANLVHALLAAQHPDLATLPLRATDSGWDNAIYRLGNDLAVRLPRRAVAAQLIRHEQAWLPQLAPKLPIAVPTPLHVGRPGQGYPCFWSIVPWLPGQPADLAPPHADAALIWAAFLRALHLSAPKAAPDNAVRGVPLSARADAVAERMQRLRRETASITPAIEALWQCGLAATPSGERTWLHGDLHAQNVLVNDGQIVAVIDWGDITAGDPATDLASVWLLFEDAAARARAIAAYAPSPARLERAKAWAVLFGVVLLDSGRINSPRHAAAGLAALRRLGNEA